MLIDMDEIYPSRSTVIGLQFETREEYERAHALAWKPPRIYSEDYPRSLFIVVRKTDAHLFKEAGLQYEEVELLDIEALPPEEARQIDREMVQEAMAYFLERMRRES